MSNFKEGDVIQQIDPSEVYLALNPTSTYSVKKDGWGRLYISDDDGDPRYVFLESDKYFKVVKPVAQDTIKQKLQQIETLIAEIQAALG